ncbi:hypothetical protein [Bradyrhizobium sp. AS23.2]|uniref:hypothetical protein n=1 Tax=Bradyrhizobium sp. AS23.2 TaxID=1680155 RepID=UPI00093B1182|nr:hypothetical protein [Bradyrhizobium sp. AS23.2]OKO78561.1 hypothetical protein AC630_18950 [Bradyrhizobium sp. AS23.2]
MAKIKSESRSQIDKIRDVHPKYANLLEKQAQLLARQDELQRELNDGSPQIFHLTRTESGERITITPGKVSLAERARRATLGWIAQLPRPKPQPKLRHAAAVELVGELLSPQPPEEIDPPPPPPNWPDEPRYRAVGQELEAIAEALNLLAPEIAKARAEYSKLVAAQHGEEYRSLVESVVGAARKLGDALLQHHEFSNQLRLDGVERKHLRPINLESFGDLEAGTPLHSVILHAVELGHVDAKQLPTWKLPASLAVLKTI